ETVFPGMVKQKNIFNSGTAESKSDNTDTFVGKYKVVNYIELIPILTKAVQEQQEIIDNQQETIEALQLQLNSIEQRLDKLENVDD
ncbi:MAG: hypothetical protein PHW82_05085, partial [Bacteroidales bacterium]|nr:hypothetical protein [Bacteroidales bacterium]